MASKIPDFTDIESAMNYLACLKIKNEELNQAVYDVNKANAIEDTCINELKAEVELLRNSLESISQTEPVKLETEDVKILKEQIRQLEMDRKEQQEENEKLNQKFAEIQAKKDPIDENDTLDISTLIKAQEENENLKKLIESQKIKNEKQTETLEEIEGIKKSILRLKDEYDQMKSLNEFSNNEYESIDQTLQAIKAENSKFSSEIATLKETPVDIQRGNSLFAEVEDRSSDLVMRHKLINMKYHHLVKICREAKMQHINLKNKNAALYSKMGTNEIQNQDAYDCDVGPSVNLNNKILELEQLMSVLDERSHVPKLLLESDDLKWFQTILNKESSAVTSSTERMRNISKELYDTVIEMCKVNTEAEKMRQSNIKTEGEIKELMSKLSEKENKESNCNNVQ